MNMSVRLLSWPVLVISSDFLFTLRLGCLIVVSSLFFGDLEITEDSWYTYLALEVQWEGVYSTTRYSRFQLPPFDIWGSNNNLTNPIQASKTVFTATRPARQVTWNSPAFLYDNVFSRLTNKGEMWCCLHLVFSGYFMLFWY